jgi:hypothetical protein
MIYGSVCLEVDFSGDELARDFDLVAVVTFWAVCGR